MTRFARFVLLFSVPVLALGAEVWVGLFSHGDLKGWAPQVFEGTTRYEIAPVYDRKALEAVSDGSASGLVKEIRVDLNNTPYLNWSWQVKNILREVDETTKAGDDYPARLYVVVSGGLFFWRTRAVNYVWASVQPQGSTWPNAFTANAQMVAVESGGAKVGQWVQEKRNVKEDLRRLFGEDIDHIDAVALMTDTDNTGQSAVAYYGDIWFSSR